MSRSARCCLLTAILTRASLVCLAVWFRVRQHHLFDLGKPIHSHAAQLSGCHAAGALELLTLGCHTRLDLVTLLKQAQQLSELGIDLRISIAVSLGNGYTDGQLTCAAMDLIPLRVVKGRFDLSLEGSGPCVQSFDLPLAPFVSTMLRLGVGQPFRCSLRGCQGSSTDGIK